MTPEDSIRMLMEDRAKWQAMMDDYEELALRNSRFSDAEREEAQAKYLRRLQEPFVYRGRPEPIMSEEEIAELERIQDDIRKPVIPKLRPTVPYDFKGM